MKLNFLINDNYLIAHALTSTTSDRFSSQKYKKDIIEFQNFAWKKSEVCYKFLATPRFCPESWIDYEVDEIARELPQYLDFLKKNTAFKKLLKQTKHYLEYCKKQWDTNYQVTETILKELTGLNFDKNIPVFITHPGLKNGCFWDNKIAWGHNEDWPNYTTIYLWHEILHSYFPNTDLDHALISLLTDEELRKRLNGEIYPPFVSHKELHPLMKKIVPEWQEYLGQKDKDIKTFRKKLAASPKLAIFCKQQAIQ